MKQRLLLSTKEQTYELGANIAKIINNEPKLILLSGDVGAGKSTLVRGFIHEILGKNINVSSPTYSYMNIYQMNHLIYHFDLYRIDNINILNSLGILEFMNDEKAIRLIEWPEIALKHLNKFDIKIDIEISDNTRIFNIKNQV